MTSSMYAANLVQESDTDRRMLLENYSVRLRYRVRMSEPGR